MLVHDLDIGHGRMVTRTLAGQISTAPDGEVYDDRVSSFSSAGAIDASAPGSPVPVGDKDSKGIARLVGGTSFR